MASNVHRIIKEAGYIPICRVPYKDLPIKDELHGVRKDALKGGFFYWVASTNWELLIQVYTVPLNEIHVITSRRCAWEMLFEISNAAFIYAAFFLFAKL